MGGEREAEKGFCLCSVVWFFRCVLCDLSDLNRLCSTEVQFDSLCVLDRDACLKLRTLSCACGFILRLFSLGAVIVPLRAVPVDSRLPLNCCIWFCGWVPNTHCVCVGLKLDHLVD